jgi:hypothetical protein
MISAQLYQSTELERGVEALVHFSKIMEGCTVFLQVYASSLVIFV